MCVDDRYSGTLTRAIHFLDGVKMAQRAVHQLWVRPLVRLQPCRVLRPTMAETTTTYAPLVPTL